MSPQVNISATSLSMGYGIIEIKKRRLELDQHKVNPICIPKSTEQTENTLKQPEEENIDLTQEGSTEYPDDGSTEKPERGATEQPEGEATDEPNEEATDEPENGTTEKSEEGISNANMDNVVLKMASLPAEGKLRISKVKPLPTSKSKSGGNINNFGKKVSILEGNLHM